MWKQLRVQYAAEGSTALQLHAVISPLSASPAPGRSAYISAPPLLLSSPLVLMMSELLRIRDDTRPLSATARHVGFRRDLPAG